MRWWRNVPPIADRRFHEWSSLIGYVTKSVKLIVYQANQEIIVQWIH